MIGSGRGGGGGRGGITRLLAAPDTSPYETQFPNRSNLLASCIPSPINNPYILRPSGFLPFPSGFRIEAISGRNGKPADCQEILEDFTRINYELISSKSVL